jgi:polysaccharide export outer membrane protein
MRRIAMFLAGYFMLFSLVLLSQDGGRLEYKIGPRDLLEIRVFGLDELNQTVRVSETGKITIPLLGEIDVEGLVNSELERKLEDLLKKEDYLQNPQVSIFIREYQSQNVSVLGAVGTPGQYEIHGNQTLLQIIAQAGSLTEEAGDEIIIYRNQVDGEDKSLRISIEELFLNGDVSLNVRLQPDDIITVPPDKEVTIFVYGKVNKPGALLVKRSKIPTLQRAIAQAGGFAEGASKGGVILTRKGEGGKETRIKVNVKDIIKGKKQDIQLKENDVIYVPESIF